MQAPFKKKSLLSSTSLERTSALGTASRSEPEASVPEDSALSAPPQDFRGAGLPEDLVKALGPDVVNTLLAGVQDLLEEMRSQKDEPEVPLDKQRLSDFLDQAVPDLPAMLHLFEHYLNARAWTSRVLVFEPAPKPVHWRLEGVYAAEPYLLPGGLSGLDDLMDGLREKVEPGSAALWVHGVALGGESLFMVYLRWPEGPPVLLTLREGQWGRVETARTRHLLLLQLVLGGAPGDTKRWKAFMAAQADWQHDNAREEFETLLGGWGLEPLSDAQWEDLVRVAYVNKSMLRLYQECARAMSEAPLLEAHGLLKAQADQFETQVKFFDKRKQELEKELEKKTKRLRSDLERSELLAKGAQTRARRLQEENAQLQRQAKPGTAQKGPTEDDFVLALDRLFLS